MAICRSRLQSDQRVESDVAAIRDQRIEIGMRANAVANQIDSVVLEYVDEPSRNGFQFGERHPSAVDGIAKPECATTLRGMASRPRYSRRRAPPLAATLAPSA